jgi:hypothetical protein
MQGGSPVALWTLIAAGIVVRLIVAFATHGLPYDIHSFVLVHGALSSSPLHLYSIVNPHGSFHWPYPPGYLPLVAIAGWLADVLGGFTHIVRIPPMIADAALTWVVWTGLEERVSDGRRLLAAGAISLGPVFIAVSGYSAQIDSVAILPAVGALLVWERDREGRRAWIAGLLIGVAAAIKTVPLVMVLALLPSTRSLREAVTLVGVAVGVLLLTLVPWLIADFSGVKGLRHYQGSPGMGGLSLVLQPDLAHNWLNRYVRPSGLTNWLFFHHASLLNLIALGAYAVFAAIRRPDPRIAAAVLWLVLLAFGSGFFFQYLIWGLPFWLLAGYVRATVVLEVVVSVPMLIFYLGPWHSDGIVDVYVPIMLAVWVAWVLAIVAIARRDTRRDTVPRPA